MKLLAFIVKLQDPNEVTFVTMLFALKKICGDIYHDAVVAQCHHKTTVFTAVINAFGNCGDITSVSLA